jgi:acyl-CoA thioester hydrolase
VNNSVYFRWFETGRIAYWRRIGLWDLLTSDRIGPILASVTCDYRRQLGYPDTIFVGTSVARIGRTSLAMEQVVVSCAEGAVAAEGRSTGVVFDYAANTSTPVPRAVRQAIAALEGWPDDGASAGLASPQP